VVNSFNGVACKFLTFTSHLINGQNTNQIPRWIGINGVISKLGETQTKLDEIATNAESANPNTDWTNVDSPKFKQSLEDIYTSYHNEELDNPNPAGSLKNGVQFIQPHYIANINNTLNTIRSEFELKIDHSVVLIGQAKEAGQSIREHIQPIKDALTEAQLSLQQAQEPYLKINSTIIEPTLMTVISY
jgi:hypothetical protein